MRFKMKVFIKYTLLLFIPFVMIGGVLTSCDDDDVLGEPAVHYVRVTNPAASDSLLESAFLGNVIAIVGENLGGARELWFNDRQAALNPAYVTDKSIITTVPNLPPTEVNNLMVIRFKDGSILEHNFVIDIPAPVVHNIQSENVPDGGELVLRGDFFYEPLKVFFPGGIEAEIVSVTQNKVRVKVPEGATSGQLVLQTNFGKATTTQLFRDNRNVFADMEGPSYGGWWHGPNYIKSEDPEINPISGKFVRINTELGNGQWFEFLVAQENSDMNTEVIPDDAIRNPADYVLKFEINTLSPFIAGTKIWMYIGNNMGSERNNVGYMWEPVLDTKGEWETVAIPFNKVIEKTPIKVSSSGYGVSFWFWQGVPMQANFAVDNFRVVPK